MRRIWTGVLFIWILSAVAVPASATVVDFPGLVSDPSDWGTNVFLNERPSAYGSLGLGSVPPMQDRVSSFDTTTSSQGTVTGRALLTGSSFELGASASTSSSGSVVEAAAVAATGYTVTGSSGLNIQGSAHLDGSISGTANLGGLLLEFFLEDYNYASGFSSNKPETYVQEEIDTQATGSSTDLFCTGNGTGQQNCLYGPRPPLFADGTSCWGMGLGTCIYIPEFSFANGDVDGFYDGVDYGNFSVNIPFFVSDSEFNGLIAELFVQAYSSTGEIETMDFLGTMSLDFSPPPGETLTLATGQSFGASAPTVPEPPAPALFGVALGALFFVRARRSKSSPSLI